MKVSTMSVVCMNLMAYEMWKRDLKTRKVTTKPSNPCVLHYTLLCSSTYLSCQRNENATEESINYVDV